MTRIVLTILIAALVFALLVAEARNARGWALTFKTGASLSFVLLAVALGAVGNGGFGAFVLAGLVLAAIGDVALALPGERAFLVGLSSFLFGHVAYVAACAAVTPPSEWLSPAALLPPIATGAAYALLASRLGSMRAPVVAYMLTITVMVVAALGVRRAGYVHGDALLAGALLFYVSDLSVARDRFVAREFVNRAWGLPAYYAGQVLMAWAARR